MVTQFWVVWLEYFWVEWVEVLQLGMVLTTLEILKLWGSLERLPIFQTGLEELQTSDLRRQTPEEDQIIQLEPSYLRSQLWGLNASALLSLHLTSVS